MSASDSNLTKRARAAALPKLSGLAASTVPFQYEHPTLLMTKTVTCGAVAFRFCLCTTITIHTSPP